MKKFIAALLAMTGFAIFFSILPMLVADQRRVAAEPPRNVANGKVVEEVPRRNSYVVVVEFSPGPGSVLRFRSDPRGAKDSSGEYARSPMKVGESVLVKYDPKNPAGAEVTSIRPLWLRLVRRAFAGGLCLFSALVVLLSAIGDRRRSVRPAGP